MRAGAVFEQLCKLASRAWPAGPEAIRAREARLRNRIFALEREILALEADSVVRGRDRAAGRHLDRLRGQRNRLDRILRQTAFHRAIEFARLDVTLAEVTRLAAATAVLLALLGSLCVAVALAAGVRSSLIPLAAVAVATAPVLGYVAVVSYPESLARRLRFRSLGVAPEAVNYLAMSMRLVPSLDRAVEFAAEHTAEPLASGLRRVLWDVYLRRTTHIENAFGDFAREWGESQEEVKRALLAIGTAGLERSDSGRERALEKARRTASEGTKSRIRDFAASLRGPTTVLFALGVLLPLVIGAMLPLMSLGGISPPLVLSGPSTDRAMTLPIVLAMDVLFPLGSLGYAYHILGKRPGTGVGREGVWRPPFAVVPLALALGLAAIAFFLVASIPAIMLIPLWALASAGLVLLLPGLRGEIATARAAGSLEADFPDALFLLGSRLSEGHPLERALQMAAGAVRGSEVSALFGRMVRALEVSRAPVNEVLFGHGGVIEDVPSRNVRAALRMAVEVSRKDPTTAGAVVMETSSYLRDLGAVDQEIRRDLRGVVDAMEMTALIFAPIVLGVTAALYGLLAEAFAEFVILGLTPAQFLGVIGTYLLMMVAILSYFHAGVLHGSGRTEMRARLACALPVSLAVFSITFLIASAALA